MRIAFTSCFSAVLRKRQPVWSEIADANPDVLVLLGDSIYLDCSFPAFNMSGLQAATDFAFAQHAHGLYTAQLGQVEFKALVQRPTLATYAIWDDHDFLWNNACGFDIMSNPSLRTLVYPSRSLFQSFRAALGARLAPNSFPAAPGPWSNQTPPPGYGRIALAPDLHLHLTDGRTWRKSAGKALLGKDQLDELEAAMDATPAGSVHLVATASVFEARSGESWVKCQPEYKRMLALAKRHNILLLSGDIHDNNLAAYDITGGRRLYEATASGAALKADVNFGSLQRNWGMLTVDAQGVHIELRKSGKVNYSGTIDRARWM